MPVRVLNRAQIFAHDGIFASPSRQPFKTIAETMEYLHDFAQSHAVALSAGILIIAYIFIAAEKISKVAVALIGACAAIFLGLVSEDKLMENGAANLAYYVNYIDFNVIFLLISMMIIVSIAAGSGIFNYAAAKTLALTRGRPVLILPALAFFTAFVSAFLDNVTTVILAMPMTFAIAEKLEINPVPFLITEVFSSNIGGTATLIGDPPNIIIGSAAGLSFMDFVRELAPIVALIMAAACAFLLFAFRKSLRVPKEKMDELMRSGGGAGAITDRACAMRSITVLSLVILGFMLHDAIGFQTSTIALAGAAALLHRAVYNSRRARSVRRNQDDGRRNLEGHPRLAGGDLHDNPLGLRFHIRNNRQYPLYRDDDANDSRNRKGNGRRIRLSALVEPLARRVPGRQHDDNRGGRQRHSIGKLRETRA